MVLCGMSLVGITDYLKDLYLVLCSKHKEN